jgi:hypothetical protein
MCLYGRMALPDIFCAQKVLSIPLSWVPGPNKTLHQLHALEIEGVTVRGLLLRIRARADLPDEDVIFQLEHPFPGRRDTALARLEWRPLTPHRNPGNAPGALRFLYIPGSHHHTFDLNWLPGEERMRRVNLPIACPISPDPTDFNAVLELVSVSFRISGLELVPVPPWEGALI